jgi:hypothetical protein
MHRLLLIGLVLAAFGGWLVRTVFAAGNTGP